MKMQAVETTDGVGHVEGAKAKGGREGHRLF